MVWHGIWKCVSVVTCNMSLFVQCKMRMSLFACWETKQRGKNMSYSLLKVGEVDYFYVKQYVVSGTGLELHKNVKANRVKCRTLVMYSLCLRCGFRF